MSLEQGQFEQIVNTFVELAVLHCVPDAGGDIWVGKVVIGIPGIYKADMVAHLLESMIEVVQVDYLVHFLGLEQSLRVYP